MPLLSQLKSNVNPKWRNYAPETLPGDRHTVIGCFVRLRLSRTSNNKPRSAKQHETARRVKLNSSGFVEISWIGSAAAYADSSANSSFPVSRFDIGLRVVK